MKTNQLSVVVALLCLAALEVSAYNVFYASKMSNGYMSYMFEQGGCSIIDNTMHDAMPTTNANNLEVMEAYRMAGFGGNVPLGGIALQAVCFTELCLWGWNQGLFYRNYMGFMRGAFHDSPSFKAISVTGVYNNFETGYPQSWNYSYWGTRRTAINQKGKWINVDFSYNSREHVCEGYQFTASDADIFPTYPNGDAIDLRSYVRQSQRSHCGQPVRIDTSGRWVNVRCGAELAVERFPWWARVLVAVGIFIIVVAFIITMMCCCLCCEKGSEVKAMERQMEEDEDNIARVPTQSQIGMSRDAALAQADFPTDSSDMGSRSLASYH